MSTSLLLHNARGQLASTFVTFLQVPKILRIIHHQVYAYGRLTVTGELPGPTSLRRSLLIPFLTRAPGCQSSKAVSCALIGGQIVSIRLLQLSWLLTVIPPSLYELSASSAHPSKDQIVKTPAYRNAWNLISTRSYGHSSWDIPTSVSSF